MGPKKGVRTISQAAFDELVRENMEELDMDPAEALQDALQTLTLQGVDLSGIVACVPGDGSVGDNPVIQCLDRLKQLDSDWGGFGEMVEVFDKLTELCSIEGSGNAAIATRNGGVEVVCSVCLKIRVGCEGDSVLVSGLKTMASLLQDFQSTETFYKIGGPKIVVGILNDASQNVDILNSGFSVVATAATGNEILKESFMDLKIDELVILIMKSQGKGRVHSIYDAICVLLTPDDNRVVASQVYGYARRFAKAGIAGALVESLGEGLTSPSLVSASIALKAVAVNDEICKSIAESGGIDAVLRCIDDSGEQGNKTVARACCSLLSKSTLFGFFNVYLIPDEETKKRRVGILWQLGFETVLAGSDTNKSAIVEKGGMDRLIKLSARFSDDPSVLQEVMAIFCVLSLRSPDNAARGVEAGAGDLAIQAMHKFPAAQQMQRNSCLMIRNLVVRNPENRTLLLSNGIEKIIRKAKENHESCKDAANDALRDLGLDYNS